MQTKVSITCSQLSWQYSNLQVILFSGKFEKYDPRDIKRFNEDDAYVRLFLRTGHSKGDPAKALPVVHESFSFRKEWEINGKNLIQIQVVIHK